MNIVFLGLSITSSWGNGHATTYRALVRELAARGHGVLFLERDTPWYAANRDFTALGFVEVRVYADLEELKRRYATAVAMADAVIVGSYVPDGIEVGEWVLETARGAPAFYDIDTPVTVAALERGTCAYLTPDQIPRYALYLSFAGGPVLARLEREFGSPCARALPCSVDPRLYHPEENSAEWDLGYLGTYSADRQPALEKLLIAGAQHWPKGRFAVAGPQYPASVVWPDNVERIEHLPPDRHRRFYNQQRFTLNVTRANMVVSGYAPSVRLFEAAACGTPIISDWWPGLDRLFIPGREIIVAHTTAELLETLRHMPAEQARNIGHAARARVLATHTAAHRAAELEEYLRETIAAAAPEHPEIQHDPTCISHPATRSRIGAA